MRREARFQAMGSEVHVVADGPPRLMALATHRIHQLEQRWSRFLPDSEVSALNRSGGRLTVVSPETFDVISLALTAWAETGGLFDPTVLGDVVRAGYDRSFDEWDGDRSEAAPDRAAAGLERGAGGITRIPAVHGLVLPLGVGIDLGGIGKGYAADLVAGEVMAAGAVGVCVNIGGDLRVAGRLAERSAWPLGVDDPFDGTPLIDLRLRAGAVATTSRVRRSWEVGGEQRHHLIDPRTGRCASTGLASVSVIAAHCWQAEVLAKAAFVAGIDHCFDVVEAAGAAAVAVSHDGRLLSSSRLADFRVDRQPGVDRHVGVGTGSTKDAAA